MWIMHKLVILFLLFLWLVLSITTLGYPVYHIILGETRSPINVNEVKVYADFPKSFEKIAIM